MKKKTTKNETPVVAVLSAAEEMRALYETAIHSLGFACSWHTSQKSILADKQTDPFAILIDLDLLTRPWETQLAQFRNHFPKAEWLALSSTDSAQAALLCLRSGFVDYMVKPTSPEELAWGLQKCRQKRELFRTLSDPRTDLIRTATQVSSCATPTLVRLQTLDYLQGLFQSKGIAWLSFEENEIKIEAHLPRSVETGQIQRLLPESLFENHRVRKIWKGEKVSARKLFLPCQNGKTGIFLWGVKKQIQPSRLSDAARLLDHAELSLLNQQKFEEVKQQTFVDDLTGLYNSRYLKFALGNIVQKSQATSQTFALLFIDVDRFKSINDRHGHVVGSEFLVALGKIIRHAVRSLDAVFRYGGDEFVVLLNGSNEAGALEIGERIRKQIEKRIFVIQTLKLQTTVSVGIALYPDHAKDPEGLLSLADQAMYAAKREERNAVYLASPLADPSKKPKKVGNY